MEAAKSFEDLIVWQKAHEFVLKIYETTNRFPGSEKYGLTSQFRRASVSIAANIAEGFRKKGDKDKLNYYNISQGSLEECRYYLILARDLKYIESTEFNKLDQLLIEVSKLLTTYTKRIRETR